MNHSFSGDQPSFAYQDHVAPYPEWAEMPATTSPSHEQEPPRTFPVDRAINARPSRPKSAERRLPRPDEAARVATGMQMLGEHSSETTMEPDAEYPISSLPFEPAIVPETYQERTEEILSAPRQSSYERPLTFEERFVKGKGFDMLKVADRIALLTAMQNERALSLLAVGTRETPCGKVRMLPYDEVEQHYKAANAKGAEHIIHDLGGVGELDFPTNRRYLSRKWIDQHFGSDSDSLDRLRETVYPNAHWDEVREPFARLFDGYFTQVNELELLMLSKVYFDHLPTTAVAHLFKDKIALRVFELSQKVALTRETMANWTRATIARRETAVANQNERVARSAERRAHIRKQLFDELIGSRFRTVAEADPDTENMDLVTTEQIESFLVRNKRNRVARKISKQVFRLITSWEDIESDAFEAASLAYLGADYRGEGFEKFRAAVRSYRHQYFGERAAWLNDQKARTDVIRRIGKVVSSVGDDADYTPRPGDVNYLEYHQLNDMPQVNIPTTDIRTVHQKTKVA